MSVVLIIHFQVKKDKLEEFSNVMNSVKLDLPKVEGCIGVRIYKNCEEPLEYTLVERWKSQDDHQQHIKQLVDSGAWSSFSDLLEKEPGSGYFEKR